MVPFDDLIMKIDDALEDPAVMTTEMQIWSLMSWIDMRKSDKSMHGEPKQTV